MSVSLLLSLTLLGQANNCQEVRGWFHEASAQALVCNRAGNYQESPRCHGQAKTAAAWTEVLISCSLACADAALQLSMLLEMSPNDSARLKAAAVEEEKHCAAPRKEQPPTPQQAHILRTAEHSEGAVCVAFLAGQWRTGRQHVVPDRTGPDGKQQWRLSCRAG